MAGPKTARGRSCTAWLRRTKSGAVWRHRTGWKRFTVIRESGSRAHLTDTAVSVSSVCSLVGAGATKRRDADAAVKIALADANREYERRFDRIFIVCATGKSAPEILEILRRRLKNDAETELHEAAEQQRQITEIRLKKWLQG